MAVYTTVAEAIAAGAQFFADAEESARKIKKDFRELRGMFQILNAEGYIGGLESEALAGQIDSVATRFEADLYRIHSQLTKRAQELGIDLPAPRDGGGR